MGYLGVDVFFVLSGYILAHVYYDQFTESFSWAEYKRFIRKRIARVYPLHFITIFGALGLLWIINRFGQPTPLYFVHLPYQLSMTHSWGFLSSAQLNFPSWSISAEWFAYILLFPLFIYLMKVNRWLVAFAIVVSFLFMQWYIQKYLGNSFGNTISIGIVRIVPEFLLGGFICVSFKHDIKFEHYFSISIPIVLGLISWFLSNKIDYIIIGLIPWGIILLDRGNLLINSIFGSKPIIWLGEISYAMYMTHFFAYRINGILYQKYFNDLGMLFYVLFYIFLTFVFSILSYYLIEMPSRKWINNFGKKNSI